MVLKFPVGINSRTEVNSPQGTAPVRYRLFVQERVPSVQGDHSLWRKEKGSNQLLASTPWKRWEPLVQPTPNQLLSS